MSVPIKKKPFSPRYAVFSILFIFCISSQNIVAQPHVFAPAPVDTSLLTNLSAKYEKQYKQDMSALPSTNKKDFEEVYKHRWDNIKEKFDSKEVFTDKEAQQYLDALVQEIVKSNPALKDRPFNCYFSRSGNPNASYIGHGIILFNMGLFERLDNESQAAFVLCHEIGHYILKHSENNIARYVTTLNSDAVQKELAKIKSTEFRKREMVENLVKGLTFNTRRHGRDHENEADSMAVELMHNTRFDVSGALTTLALLDSIDIDTLKTAPCLERMFNAKNYPFQKKWIKKEEGLLGGHALIKKDEEMADSLKTHPDCKLRMKALEPMINKYSNATATKDMDKPRFDNLKNKFRYEVIEYAFASDNYTRSLYYTLEMIQNNPVDPYLVAQVGKIFNGFHNSQKAHKLSKIVELPSPSYPSNYNLLLQFVQNLYLENFASISYHFLNQHHPQLDYYAPYKNAYSASIMIAQQ
jgi:Zn-dependent protease with chaperone function